MITNDTTLIGRLGAHMHNLRDLGYRHIADAIGEALAAITDLQARLRIAEKRAEDAEARNDFLITELDILRERARQS
jgi:hypothetical protein